MAKRREKDQYDGNEKQKMIMDKKEMDNSKHQIWIKNRNG